MHADAPVENSDDLAACSMRPEKKARKGVRTKDTVRKAFSSVAEAESTGRDRPVY